MLYQLLVIHLYRPFLKYTKANTPLPPHVSPRKICTQAAATVSKLLRVYKRGYGLKQICNIAVYIAHTTCTIHLLNLPDKNAQRDVIHGLKNLEEMAEGWLCARRTLRILDISANKWNVELPPEATAVLERTHTKWGSWGSWDQAASPSVSSESPKSTAMHPATSPSRFSPTAPPFQPSGTEDPSNPLTMVNSRMSPQFGVAPTSIPMSLPSMRATHSTLSAQLQRPEFAPPEPTYLRPQVAYQFPPIAPTSSTPQQNAWFDGSGAHVPPQNGTPPSNASPVSGYDGTENLVEESQDWWSRNATYGMGIGGWNGSWNHPSPNQQPQINFQNDNLVAVPQPQPQPPAPAPNVRPEHSQIPLGVPIAHSPSDPNGDTGFRDGWQ